MRTLNRDRKNPMSSDGADTRLPVCPPTTLSSSSRYFDDGKELVAQIQEKLKELPDDVGEDFSKAESFHRMHAAFERDITALGRQVRQLMQRRGNSHRWLLASSAA